MSTICILAGIFVVLCIASYADAYALSSVAVSPSQNAPLASPTALAVVASRYQLPPRDFALCTFLGLCSHTTSVSKPTTNVLLSVTSYQSTSDAGSEDASKTAAPAPEPTSLRPLPAPTSSNSPDSTTESSSASLSSASPDSTTESNSASLSYASPSVSSTTSSSGAASHTKVPSITTPSAPGVRSASASSSDSVVPAATTATSIQSKGISPTPVSANATSPRSDVRTWVTVLIIACVVLILSLVFIGIWLLRRRRAGHLARDSPSFVESPPSKDSLTFARLSETSHSSFGVASQRPRLPSIHCDGNRESALAAPCSVEQRHTAYVASDPSDVTSVAAVFDHPFLDHDTRPPTRLSGRPTLRLSLENIDDFLRHSNALPSSTTWQSPQLPPHNVSPKLAVRPPSSVLVLGRLSWHPALTPRTTMSRSVVNELPSWPARPASHARPRGPRAQGERGSRTLDHDQDIADALHESTVSPYRRRADDGGVRLAGGPLPPVGQDAPPGDKGSSEGRVSSDSSGGSSEVTLPPAYAMY